METLEEQEALGNLLQHVDDAHYTLYKALFKFQITANCFPEIAALPFVEVEEALKVVETSLQQVRMAMICMKGEMHGEHILEEIDEREWDRIASTPHVQQAINELAEEAKQQEEAGDIEEGGFA